MLLAADRLSKCLAEKEVAARTWRGFDYSPTLFVREPRCTTERWSHLVSRQVRGAAHCGGRGPRVGWMCEFSSATGSYRCIAVVGSEDRYFSFGWI